MKKVVYSDNYLAAEKVVMMVEKMADHLVDCLAEAMVVWKEIRMVELMVEN